MRLDAYLVEMGCFKSRGRAKNAIHNGNVKVSGTIIRKPSKDISAEDQIEVEEGLDMPRGYFKLRHIQDATCLITENDSVLDIGSSAGGFLLFASEIASKVRGVEYSKDFRSELGNIAHEKENVSVIFADAFRSPLKNISLEQVHVLLIDMTLEPLDSVQALERMLPLLKVGGKFLLVIKIEDCENRKTVLARIGTGSVRILEVIEPEQMEIYVIGEKTEG
ncbi:S4 domain-containing protein [Methanolobus halotolerans]|uniref:Cell division protein FtsJ n=1 Tax=Methanolobus halotolerans TaxID=2052935 RepID=A0A4E0PXI8_9EURY|nr:S4 domain-containing protein [Methanolobus halotolerans]TGC09472.1 cell division protein FtsJ [Methanolobus halotolerans]